MFDPTTIGKLTPAAARLLLAFWTAQPEETYEEMILRAGVTSCLTLASAKKQLQQYGFWDSDESRRDGRE